LAALNLILIWPLVMLSDAGAAQLIAERPR
jgi:hypothetical protein